MQLAVHLPRLVIVNYFVKPSNFCSSKSTTSDYHNEALCAHGSLMDKCILKQRWICKEKIWPWLGPSHSIHRGNWNLMDPIKQFMIWWGLIKQISRTSLVPTHLHIKYNSGELYLMESLVYAIFLLWPTVLSGRYLHYRAKVGNTSSLRCRREWLVYMCHVANDPNGTRL